MAQNLSVSPEVQKILLFPSVVQMRLRIMESDYG